MKKRTMLSVKSVTPAILKRFARKMSGFEVQDGDEIHIFPIAPYNSASIYLQGHVLRPGRYSYKPEMKLTDLVASYADLLPEPSFVTPKSFGCMHPITIRLVETV